jgi:hypothetical protein
MISISVPLFERFLASTPPILSLSLGLTAMLQTFSLVNHQNTTTTDIPPEGKNKRQTTQALFTISASTPLQPI